MHFENLLETPVVGGEHRGAGFRQTVVLVEGNLRPVAVCRPQTVRTAAGGGFVTVSQRHQSRAFSLVEVVLAIGIVAFAFVPLFGLLPVGLTTFRQAIDTTIGSQIMQEMVNDAQQTNFSTLTGAAATTTRYFDDQGNDVTVTTASGNTAPANYLYVAQASVSVPTFLPTTLTGSTVASNNTISSNNLATLTVKFAVNPAHNASPFATGSVVPYVTESTVIAKNQ